MMLTAAIVAILVTMFLALIRTFLGPTEYDRMLAANSFGTKTVLLIALAGYALSWNSYLDVALLYALLNFVGTIAVMRFFEYRNTPEEGDGPESAT
jgi:multicomponent Na+:H+ antiporter subunit F